MKIAYFVNQYPKVSHSFIRREILALERQGFEILRVALRGWDGPLPDEADQRERRRTRYVLRHGVSALLLPLLAALLRSPARFFSALGLAVRMSRHSDRPLPYHVIYFAEACRIVAWLMEFGAEHVHAHFGTNSAEIAMLTHVLGGPPYSFTVHGPDEFIKPMGLEEKIHRAAFVIAISDFGRSQLYMRSRHADWSRIEVVHCGVERGFFEGAGAPVPQAPRLVCVGRLCEAKGQLLLVEAAARLAVRKIPFELVLAGDGPLHGELQALIRELRLDQQVRITGWISGARVRSEMLEARALVLPSFAEGLPVVIMEAMTLCRPVLTTYVAGIPELVRQGETGWLVPAGSLDELAKAMEDCLSKSAEELQAMGNAAHTRVIARHSIETEAAKLGKLFHAARASRTATQCRDAQPADES
ncbi:MAG TPA: glycosyltransferase family 4 protein [Steroidobacteraceae bacterium]|nr:glycosyltransferase family 4 protein [Steroidobacteraceae bacterium]